MPWVRIDDQLSDHPKIVAAGPDAAWLFITGLCYASRYLTDGFIPEAQVRRLSDIKNPGAAAKKLVSNGLWDAVEGGYMIHDYLEYNSPADKIKEQRQRNAERQARWRDKRSGDDVTNGGSNASRNGVTNEATNGSVTMPQSQSHISTPNGVHEPDEDELVNNGPPPVFEKPIEYVMALCEEMGQPLSEMGSTFKKKQFGIAENLALQGHTVDRVRRCIRWLRTDDWWLNKGIDLQTVAGQIDKFELAGEPEAMGRKQEPVPKTTDVYPRIA